MKALIYYGPRELRLEEVPLPEIKDNEILIKMHSVGVCGSDFHAYQHKTARRKPPVIMGHEASGVVTRIGKKVKSVKEGDRIAPYPVISCGSCNYCLKHADNLCKNRKVLGVDEPGCFAEYFKITERQAYKIPESVSFQLAALAEPFSVGLHPVLKALKRNLFSVLVIGAGTIGLMVIKAAIISGVKDIWVTDIDQSRISLAEKLGAREYDPVRKIGVDTVFDAVGVQASFDRARECARTGADIFLLGMSTDSVKLDLLDIVAREISFSGSYISTSGEFQRALKALSPDMLQLISLKRPLDESVEMFEELLESKGKIIKAVIGDI